MLNSQSVLGLSAGVVDVANEPQKSGLGVVLDAIKNPLHAALLVMVYFVWWTTAKVDKAQDDIKRELAATTANTAALVQANQERASTDRLYTALMRQICIGVNKNRDQEKCGQ